jgi:uncharacterized protein YjdB
MSWMTASLAAGLAVACSSDGLAPGNGPTVASISVQPAVATVSVGGSFSLRAEPRSPGGEVMAGQGVRWASEDPDVAQVSAGGVVTGVSVGTVLIAASVQGKDALAEVTVTPTPVASIRLSVGNRSMLVGESLQLTADPLDNGGNVLQGRPVEWTTSNASVATVTGEGLVTAVATGGAVIRATAEGRSAVASISVSAVPVASIEVNPTDANLVVGQTTQLTAEPRDSAGEALAGRVVTWSTSNPQVATVTSSGLVTAISVGTTTITAASDGRLARVTVTVAPRPVSTVVVSPSQVSIHVGQKAQLNASPTDAQGNPLTGRPVNFSSSNTAVATISTGGLVTAVAPGSATITATSEGNSGTASVTVTPAPVVSVSITPSSTSIGVGSQTQLTAVPRDGGGQVLTGRTVTWTSGAPGLASVSGTGLVTGIAAGTAVILANVEGVVASATVSVGSVAVASVSVSPTSANLTVGGTASFTATLRDAAGNVLSGRVVGWSSSDQAVATVSQSGQMTAVGAGSATITATAEGQTGTATVTVAPGGPGPIVSITLSPSTLTLAVGGTQALTATALDAQGNVVSGAAITWSSGNNAVATVSQSGVVTAVAPGTVVITAASGTVTGSATVTVQQVPVARIVISPADPTIREKEWVQLTATLYDANDNVLTGRPVAWSSSDASKVSVDSTGLVTGKKKGTETITATSGGTSGSTTVRVR